MAHAFWGTSPNLNRAVNELNRRAGWIQTLLSNVGDFFTDVADGLGDQVNGVASIAEDADIENAVQWAIAIAKDNKHGYDWTNRDGPDYDCSSLVYHALTQAGFNITKHQGTFWTGSMHDDLIPIGFKYHTGTDKLKRGDIMWSDTIGVNGHTEIYIGKDKFVGAHQNELGTNVGGETGDQTGDEIGFSIGVDSRWKGYFRYEPPSTTVKVPTSVPQTGLVGDYTANYGSVPWASGTNQRRVYNKWNLQATADKYKVGIATLNKRYLVAVRPTFGKVGDKIVINLADGMMIHAIIADEKGDDATSKWGHVMDGKVSVVEWEAQTDLPTDKVPASWRGKKVKSITNYGSIL